jgi:hypothetical protein
MKIGDVSRRRRLADPARVRWYAHHRAVRFARRMARAAGLAYSARFPQCLGGMHACACQDAQEDRSCTASQWASR